MILTERIVKKEELIDKNGHCDVPEGYTKIDSYAFYECTRLKSINIPDSVESVGNCAFYNCTNLRSINLSNNLKIIMHCAFEDCVSLRSIELPSSLKEIGICTFYNCINLSSINIPSSLKNIIEYNTFYNCTSLPKINVGKEILEIALKDNYFEQCYGLCSCFDKVVTELMLKYKKPICLGLELPMFTIENAILHANGSRNENRWFENNSDRKKFLEWMLSEVESINS